MKFAARIAAQTLAVALLLTLVCRLSAQTSSATISGHVVDPSGAAVTSADITLTNELTNVAVTAHTNSKGDFQFPDTQPGTFTVLVHSTGFKDLRQTGLVLSASQ